ncbi:butyrate kinase [Geothrix sp. 21YS21S-2]|uniref:butyrate kinase n=1 Tax=Geothrix sp. 21YS21S-2 TaxID=3068893 RepID=UPI0027B994F8|nr:butyrate kinase [Geothrix sp. 21YS21S-2]
MARVLALNPGATSTKLAVFEDETACFRLAVEHQGASLEAYPRVIDQLDYRLDLILKALAGAGIDLAGLDAVVGRGGLLKPIEGGTYAVNAKLLADLAVGREHASNLGGILADRLATPRGIPAFIVDPVSVDEMEPEARLSGLPELPRISFSHALNSKAVARRTAQELGGTYADFNFVVAHLGTGVSITAHRKGRMVDVSGADEEGPFSPGRSAGLPSMLLAKLCYSGKYTEKEMMSLMSGSGGLYAHLGTRDVREAEKRAAGGDAHADLVLKAMAYRIGREIGAMATVLEGQVDRIVITGGIAYSERMVADVTARVAFIAPVRVMPGEEELEALAEGALRVLRGQEAAKVYS